MRRRVKMASACLRSFKKGVILTPLQTCSSYIPRVWYAKKIGVGSGKVSMNISQKVELDVETDPVKLTNYCCGANINITGPDPELKPDSEYPDWLWSLNLDRKPPDLSELDPDSFYYWGRVRKMHRRRIYKLMKTNKLK